MCIFMPRVRPFDFAQPQSLPKGMGVESTSLSAAPASRRARRSIWPASRAKASANTAGGRRAPASARVERDTAAAPRW